ncbi:MAG TPA: FAD-dependent oxidoreductase, partial [Candidatus Limnocylindrales bacterium]|nr:FAD-dependent oxidoreductase [Candidatus Limnocylindrales bacterium]
MEGLVEHTRAVVIGGGVGGTSIAYHLAERGWTDIVLVDRAELTSGSTFHSAGLVGQLRGSVTLTKMMMYGTDLYRRLREETGVDPSWHEVGSLRLASSPARYEELQRQAGWAKTFGLPLELITAREAQQRFPLMTTDGVLGAVWLPTDGWLDPSGLAMALAAGARKRGATVRTHSRVVGIGVERGRVTGVEIETRDGERRTIATDVVVNAGGMFAPEIGRLAGVTIPIIPMAHQYLFTEAIEGVHPGLPQLRDPDNLVYFREEVGGLCMGGYERTPAPWSLDGIPPDFNGKLLAPDWPRFEEIMAGAVRRVPAIADAGVSRIINGPEGFTPDNEFILGESEIRGFFVAAGFSAHGIAGAGGIGRQVASWIVDGEPELDLWHMDIRRFGSQHWRSRVWTLARTTEVYATYYDIHYPSEERQAGRPLRVSPTYPRLIEQGAAFGEKSGWERVNWFEANERAGHAELRPRGWAGHHWSPAIEVEALAARQHVALFDETSFAKIEVGGPGATGFLQHLCANDLDVPVGRITYTSMLNKRGGIEADLTVTRLEPDRYLLVTGTAFGAHDLAWLRKHDPADGSVWIRDVTSSLACLGVWGPNARALLAGLTNDDLSNEAFPYLTAAPITIGSVPVQALRVTYVGELGWELYAPMEYGLRLWDTIVAAGTAHGLTPGGYRAIDALRLEKGYRV